MKALTTRPYAGEMDLEAIAALMKSCEAIASADEWPSSSKIFMQFSSPLVDKQEDLCLWENAEGQLIAAAGLMLPPEGDDLSAFVWWRIHPTARVEALYRDILQWAEKRVRSLAKVRAITGNLLAATSMEQTEEIVLLESCGFQKERYFMTMERSLNEPIPEPQLPPDFSFKAIDSTIDAAAWVEMFNDTFIDHWNYQPDTIEAFNHRLRDPEFCSDLSAIAVAPDGTFAAFCECYMRANVGRINLLGTRRGYRHRGLARALLLRALQGFQTAGNAIAILFVDADNLCGALRLYESVGFCKTTSQVAYLKTLS